ncbi:type II toxin-antitoxin system CcdA family antitoxin [Rheinheimera sp. EpRS3]|uniref:type II toxin-antitoxin system CcdA family antitoxin n=1 Tax=Rheinheimera sp. EpRS3 TaxID=1712383 RepID=UPI00074725F3|nr:type II toxin-antitoxin system CcdA family antitoxin [Rheinheimera sp. EpRS3]KUM53310.1 post-segregation antitoxin CcdA [Rheinheimera sp. EpRS3]
MLGTGPEATHKKRTNLSIDSQLLQEAKQLGINVSQSAEAGLAQAVSQQKQQRWLQENNQAIESSNDFVAHHGLPLAQYQHF